MSHFLYVVIMQHHCITQDWRLVRANQDDDAQQTLLRHPELVSPQREYRVSFASTTQHCTTERYTRYTSCLPYRPPYHPFPVYGLIVDRACRSKPLRLNVRLKIGECSGPPEPARLLLLPIFCLSGEPWPHGCATTTRSRHVIGIRKAGEGRRVVVSEGDRRCRGRGCN